MTIANAAPEYGAKMTLTAADGTKAVFNDSTDANYVGPLAEDTSGLDGADVREDAADIPEDDGGVQGSFYSGRRAVVLSGDIFDGTGAEARNERIARLQYLASAATRGNVTLTWTPKGATERTLETLKRNQPLRVTGAFHKKFMLPLIAADPRIYGPTTTLTKTYTPPTGGKSNSAKTPVTVASESIGVSGGKVWTNPENAKTSNNVYATCSLGSEEPYTKYLASTNFGFAIPSTSKILGVKVSIEAAASVGEALKINDPIAATYVELLPYKTGLTGSAINFLTTGDVVYNYGGESSLWGHEGELTPTSVNASTFGVRFAIGREGAAAEAKIDAVTITVYYEEGGELHTETITNNGNAPAYPKLKIYGKTVNPTFFVNYTTGDVWEVDVELPTSSDTLEIDFRNKTVINRFGGSSANVVHFPTDWVYFSPGSNSIGLPASSKIELTYRDAWL